MVQELMLGIVLSYLRLMEYLVLFKAKMDGIGRNMEFKEMIGKLGRNGR
jgi:hypothetical protein